MLDFLTEEDESYREFIRKLSFSQLLEHLSIVDKKTWKWEFLIEEIKIRHNAIILAINSIVNIHNGQK